MKIIFTIQAALGDLETLFEKYFFFSSVRKSFEKQAFKITLKTSFRSIFLVWELWNMKAQNCVKTQELFRPPR